MAGTARHRHESGEPLIRQSERMPGRISWRPGSLSGCQTRDCRTGRTLFPIPDKCCKGRASET